MSDVVGVGEHEAGIARFLTPSRATRWLAAKRPPEDFSHFEPRFDPAFCEALSMKGLKHEGHVAVVLERLRAEGAGATCVLFRDQHEWDEPAATAEAIPDLMLNGCGIASFVPGRLALWVGEFGSGTLLLKRAG